RLLRRTFALRQAAASLMSRGLYTDEFSPVVKTRVTSDPTGAGSIPATALRRVAQWKSIGQKPSSPHSPATQARRHVMARLNTLNLDFGPRTHEGARARHISTEMQLRRSVLACLLWENQFYENGTEIAGRIAELVPKVAAEKVAALALEAREQMKL